MLIYDIILENREIFKLIYTLIIGLICTIIVLKTDKLYKLSLHEGIRYFRNAFFFYGLAFIAKYLLGSIYVLSDNAEFSPVIKGIFEFFLIMAGFSLLYSLVWRNFESGRGSKSSFFNLQFAIFYVFAAIIAVLDILWMTYSFMFSIQIAMFLLASIISYRNYERTHRFQKLYLTVILLNLIAWIANFVVATFLDWHAGRVIGIYVLNIIIFCMLLYGVVSGTKKNG